MRTLGLGEVGEVEFINQTPGAVTGRLAVRVYSGVRHRVKRSGRTKAEARKRVMEAVAELLRGNEAVLSSSDLFATALTRWLERFKEQVDGGRRAASTYDLYRDVVTRYVAPDLGQLRVGELSTPRLDRYLRKLHADRGYSVAKTVRTVLSGACRWAVLEGALTHNPVREVSPISPVADRTARPLTVEEVREWLAVLDADPKAQRLDLPELARFMLGTGLRLGEALGAHWEDIDFDTRTLEIKRTVYRIKGKGIVPSRLKTKTSQRRLVLPGWLVELLTARRERLGGADDAPVFPSAAGTYRDRANGVGPRGLGVRLGQDAHLWQDRGDVP